MHRSTFVAIIVSLLVTFFYYSFHIGLNTEHVFYLRYATSSMAIVESRFLVSPLYLILNEPLWLIINVTLTHILGHPVIVISVMFYFVILVKVFYVVKHSYQFWPLYFILFFDPNFYLHLRQQVAIALFLFLVLIGKRKIATILSSLTHIIMISAFLPVFRRFLLRYWFILAIFMLTIACIGPDMPRQLSNIGSERLVKSGLGLILYSFVFLIMIRYKTYSLDGVMAKYYLGFYVGSYFFMDLPQRFLIVSFPFILVYASKISDRVFRNLSYLLLHIPLFKDLIF